MFHSAALRLTIWYLVIIMAISLVFSALLYQVSSAYLERNANRQTGYFNNFLGPRDIDNYTSLRHQQLDSDERNLRTNLVVFNVVVLTGGGLASYWLARRTLQPIEEALKAQSRFAADASHELRTPLTAIQTENEVALRNPNLKKDDAVAVIKSNLEEVAKLKALSEGLLRLANNSGKLDDPQPVSVVTCLESATDRLTKAAALKKVKIDNRAKDFVVCGDQDSLTELFYALIDNAIKFSPSGEKITLSSQRHGKEITVTVADKGPGIKAEDLPRIFERFYRTDDSRTKQGGGGYGLGLAIANKIAGTHGGHIEVKSAVGKGSSFIVHLPAA